MTLEAAVDSLKKHQEILGDRKIQYQSIFLGVLVVLTLMLAVVRVVMANMLVDQSVEVAKVEAQIEKTNDQSEKLVTIIRDESSVARVSDRAQTLGFAPITSYTYLPHPQNVAARFDFSL